MNKPCKAFNLDDLVKNVMSSLNSGWVCVGGRHSHVLGSNPGGNWNVYYSFRPLPRLVRLICQRVEKIISHKISSTVQLTMHHYFWLRAHFKHPKFRLPFQVAESFHNVYLKNSVKATQSTNISTLSKKQFQTSELQSTVNIPVHAKSFQLYIQLFYHL